MSLFRFAKYSTILFFLNRHRSKLFRSIAVLLFALVTSLLYEDLRIYLDARHPDTLVYALLGKAIIVYGALGFVLFQFRPEGGGAKRGEARAAALAEARDSAADSAPADRLSGLADLDRHDTLRTRYERIIAGEGAAPRPASRSSTKSRRS